MCVIDDTFKPLITSAEDALREDMKRFDFNVQLQMLTYGDFEHALRRGEDMITLGMIVQEGLHVLERVIFNPFNQSLSIMRDSSVDPVLASVMKPFLAIAR